MKKSNFWIVIILGILIRVILGLSTFHPDIRPYQLAGQLIANGHGLDFYDYLYTLSADDILVKTFNRYLFNYPPAIYLFHGLFNFIFANILGLSIINKDLIENFSTFGNWDFSFHLLLLKLPYAIFDILGAVFITKLFEDKKQKFLALTLWIFNPINLYATWMIGQHDIIPMSLSVMALYLTKRSKLFIAALFLGLGMAFKIYPIFLLVPLALLGKKWWIRIGVFFVGLVPYVLFILPFLGSRGYRMNALVADQTMKSFYAQIPISGGESIILFPTILITFYIIFYMFKKSIEYLWQGMFIALLIFFIFTHTHPQWFLWISPFFIIDFVYFRTKNLFPFLIILLSYIGLLFFFDPSLTLGLFAPLNPSLYGTKNIWELLNLHPDLNFSRSILQSIFVAGAIYYIYYYFPREKTP